MTGDSPVAGSTTSKGVSTSTGHLYRIRVWREDSIVGPRAWRG